MTQSYEVVTAALTAHARILRELSGELTQAADTASGVNLTADAYGQIGQPFVTTMAALAKAGQDALRTGLAALDAADTAMSDTVTTYEQQETGEVTRFAAVGEELAPEGHALS